MKNERHIRKLIFSAKNIQWLIDSLEEAKKEGANMVRFVVSKDPSWPEENLECYYKMSPEEIKQLEIKQLEQRLKQLKGTDDLEGL